jgi:hypothetical protein
MMTTFGTSGFGPMRPWKHRLRPAIAIGASHVRISADVRTPSRDPVPPLSNTVSDRVSFVICDPLGGYRVWAYAAGEGCYLYGRGRVSGQDAARG